MTRWVRFQNTITQCARTAVQALLVLTSLAIAPHAAAQSLEELAGNFAGCAVIGTARASMPVAPLFRSTGQQCISENPRSSSISTSLQWHTDEACANDALFVPTPLTAFCADIAGGTELGAAENIVPQSWTLTPGNRLNIGALSLDNVPQPYMQRVKYASFATARGQCELEMRVYSPYPDSSGLRSLVALHGGSWRFRGLGFFGLEASVAHWVDAGFVVYAPFYRLIDDVDGSTACQNARIQDLTADAETALNWVLANAERYGSQGSPVVLGQSAGAHLAGSLWLNRRDDVSAAVLLYPPTDFTHFIQSVRLGEYTNQDGIDILENVLGTDAASADLSVSPIPENSFPLRVAEQPEGLAPVMLLHGEADELVDASQSIRLCNALAGRSLMTDFSVPVGDLVSTVSCDAEASNQDVSSELRLFKEGQHALDVCIDNALLGDDACPAGSPASADLIGAALSDATAFAQQAFDAHHSPLNGNGGESSGNTGGSSSGSSSSFGAFSPTGVMALLLLLLTRIRLSRPLRWSRH